jgi:O-antigen/teichoic acid export membrane protein
MTEPSAGGEDAPVQNAVSRQTDPRRRKGGTFRNNVKWQLVGSAGQAVLSGLVLLLMARQLGAHDFGVFSIVMGLVYVANALVEPRMQDVAAKQFWSLHDRDKDARGHAPGFVDLLLVEVVAKLAPCLALAAAAPLLESVSHLPTGGVLLIVCAAIGTYLSKLGYGLSVGLLRVLGRSDLFVFCTTAELLARLLLLGGAVLFGKLTVLEAILIQSFTGLISIGLQWWCVRREVPTVATFKTPWNAAAAMARLRVNLRLLLSNIALSMSDLMSKDLDITLMSFMTSASNIGIYKMAKNIALLTWRAVEPFILSLMPEVNRMISTEEYPQLRRLQRRSAIGLFAMTMTMAVGTSIGVWLLGERLFGPAYAPIPQLMPLVMAGLVVGAPLVWGHPLAVALNRADLAVAGSVVGTIVGVSTLLLLTPTWGIYGAGLAWSLTFICQFIYTAVSANALLGRTIRAKAAAG